MTGIAPEQASEESTPTLDDFLIEEEDHGGEQDIEQQPLDDLEENSDEAAEEIDEEEAEDQGEPDEGEEEAPEVEDVPMPQSWSKEDAKVWSEMSPEQRAIVGRREAERDKFVRGKAFEATQVKQQVENQARDLIAKMHDDHALSLQVYAQQFQAQQPDQRLLYSNDPNDIITYQRQKAAYDASVDQQHALHQQIAQARQQAEAARTQAQQAELASDAQRLKEQLPEWFEPSTAPELQRTLESIGAELGYPAELMAQASSTDILALKRASDWKAKAEKYDKLIAKRMEGVRAAKALPRMARPGVKPGKGQQQSASANRRETALNSFGQTRSGDAAAALLLERIR